MNRFQRSWALLKQSFKVIGSNKKLLIYPIIITFFSLLIISFFIVPVVIYDIESAFSSGAKFYNVLGSWVNQNEAGEILGLKPIAYIIFVLVYFTSMFLTTFFNVAFYNEILNALNGNKVVISRGLKFAMTRIPQIFVWSLLAGLVGVIIKQLEEKLGFIGSWLVRLLGIGWSIASVFVIPVIIREEKSKNPIKYLKDSALILKKTWGESLAGYLGINFIGGFFTLTTLALVVGVAILCAVFNSWWLLGITFIIWLLCAFIFNYILHVANHVYRCALFIYASEGVVPEYYSEELMETAWKVKASRNKK